MPKRLYIAAALCGLVVTTSAAAYKLKGYSWSYKPSPMGEPLTICTKGGPAGASDVIKRAAAVWNYKKFTFTFAPDRCLEHSPPNVDDNVNYVDFSLALPLHGLTAARNEQGTVKTSECDIQFNPNRPWHVGSGPPPAGKFDLMSVAIHELGHCLGLEDSDVADVVMDGTLPSGKMRRTLSADDIAGRNKIYGAP
ncbi:matrixin family metalloprotease [Sphingobium sp. PNB]|uniref:matrixin family metalloprotease n=1 Tax=Sphingobium sp. PNB TaxID=863934 RepID=UPI001CA3D125|nr:matrixin family metalloprotease [Sphingobium sp. PNB]MCB4859177.1 matrixin family metalloprotease [Sphingobium sp. PNB]